MAFRKVSFSTCCELWVTRLLVLSVKWVVFELTGIAAVITGEIRVSCHQLLETTEELRSRLYVVQPVETRRKAAPLREVNTHDFMTHGGFQHSLVFTGGFFFSLCHATVVIITAIWPVTSCTAPSRPPGHTSSQTKPPTQYPSIKDSLCLFDIAYATVSALLFLNSLPPPRVCWCVWCKCLAALALSIQLKLPLTTQRPSFIHLHSLIIHFTH